MKLLGHSALVALISMGLPAIAAAASVTKAPAPKEKSAVRTETVVTGLDHPWAIQFLPEGGMLVTERPGTMRLIAKDGTLSPPIAGVPKVVAVGQGGLLDVALAPDFAQSRRIFFTFSEPRGGGRNATAVASATLTPSGNTAKLDNVKVIFRQQPAMASTFHFGSRIAIAPDGTLFVTLGERNRARDQAQNPANHIGKVVHIDQDGLPAPGNPRKPGWAPTVWSIGHRNPQAAAIHPQTGQLWTVEHGARGGDELNRPQAGRNYGWPVITYGRDYSGARIGEGTSKPGMEQPVYYWDPSIAPSGMTFYTGKLFPAWNGSILVGALAGSHVARLVLDGDAVVAEEKLLAGLGERIRDVRQGPDGAIYIATDSAQGRILKIVPAGPG
ncbi:MAG: PQQ-dependent sugar dehydrogenase [Hyphomicrobiaceae bacterium]